jgi:hypothetical protein
MFREKQCEKVFVISEAIIEESMKRLKITSQEY